MSTSTKYELKGSRSIGFHKDDGKFVSYEKGAKISEKELKEVPKRQQGFFEEVEITDSADDADEEKTEGSEETADETSPADEGDEDAAEEETSEAPSLAEQIDEKFTVDELKEELDAAEVNYARSSNKPALIEYYIKYIHEADEEE